MTKKININKLPENIKDEVMQYAQYLLGKYKLHKLPKKKKWSSKINRGQSVGEMASKTVEKMRKESKW